MIRQRSRVAIVLAALLSAGAFLRAQTTSLTPDVYKQLNSGTSARSEIASSRSPASRANPNVYYVGAASGGIFKTIDNGAHWNAIFDDQPVSSIGSLAVAPSDPNVVWAGTGEAFIRSNISIGNGIYKSTDAGKTWTHAGLDRTGRIGRVVIDPRNPDVVLCVCARTCVRSTAGTRRVSHGRRREDTGSGRCSSTRTPAVRHRHGREQPARSCSRACGRSRVHTWGRTSGGPGSGLFKSVDGGMTWNG